MPARSSSNTEVTALVSKYLLELTDDPAAARAMAENELRQRARSNSRLKPAQRSVPRQAQTNSFQALEALEAALQEHQDALAVRRTAGDGARLADWKVLVCETTLWVEFRENENLRNEFWKRHASAVRSQGRRADLLSFLNAIHPLLTESQRTHRANALEQLVGIDANERLQAIKNAGGIRGVARLRTGKPSRRHGKVLATSSDDGHVTENAINEASGSFVPGRDSVEAHINELLSADPVEWDAVPRSKLQKLWAILSKHFGFAQPPKPPLRTTNSLKAKLFNQPVTQ